MNFQRSLIFVFLLQSYLLDAARISLALQPALKIVKLDENATIPKKANEFAVGFDLFLSEPKAVLPNTIAKLRTGIGALAPPGTYLRITGRSGMTSLGFLVQTGVIDPDYTGEILVVMHNATTEPAFFPKGTKIAQMIPETYSQNCQLILVDEICFAACAAVSPNARGNRGFGSSGF